MIYGKRMLAIVPARGGSKGLRGKNIKMLAGKPLIAWTIDTAKECRMIDKIVVSTDDTEIASIAKRYGAEAPFLRPAELAADSTSMIDVIGHCIKWLEEQKDKYDLVILLQPTSPLRSVKDIENVIKTLFKLNARSIISVCEVDHHPYWTNTLPDDHSMKEFINLNANVNRQNLPAYYRLNGAVYLSFIDYFKKYKGFYGKSTYAYIMPKERSVDIDSNLDLKLAEVLINEQMVG